LDWRRADPDVHEGTDGVGADMDVEELIAIAKVQEEGDGEGVEEYDGGEGHFGEEVLAEAKQEKKGKRGRKARKPRDSEGRDEEDEEQLGGENEAGVNNGHVEDDAEEPVSQSMEGVQRTTNFGLDGAFDNVEYSERPTRSRKSNSTTKKRKRKSADSDDVFKPAQEEPEEDPEEDLAETKSAKNRGRNTRSRKSQNTVVEEQARDADVTQNAIPEPEREQVPPDLAALRQKLRRAKKNAKISPHTALDDIITAAAEDDNDSAAALHRPLTPAHMGHHRTSSHSLEEAAARLHRDAQSRGSAVEEDELEMTPEQPSKKALGKRKASNIEASVSKKRKTQKDKAAGTPELASFGFFSQSSEPQRRSTPMFTPINRPKAKPPILPPSARRPVVEIPIRNNTDEAPKVPEAPKSSKRKKKRHLPVGDDEQPDPKTPVPKGAQKSKIPKSAAATSQSRTPATTVSGRLSNEEKEAIKTAVESYRDQNDLTQVEINDLIHKDAKTTGLELWKYIYGEVPDIPRQKVLNTCRRTFHNFAARGAWTEEQDQEFREVYERYPGKWSRIGEALNRFPEDCRDRWRNYLVCGDNMKKDVWNKEEEERLKEVVEECIELVREMKRVSTDPRTALASAESLVDWNVVSQKMDHTRSRLQCIQKWKKIKDLMAVAVEDPIIAKPISETWRLDEAEGAARKMKPKEKLLLLYAIRDSGAGREGKIPWRRVQAEVPGKPRKMAMRVAFRQMRQHIEGNEDMALQDIVDLLVDAFEASVPSEPPEFDDNFQLFHSSQKILSTKKKIKRKAKAEAPVESSSDDNGEGPSTITKPKRKTRSSEKIILEDDREDDPYAIPPSEQPTKPTRRKAASGLQTDDVNVVSSATGQRRKTAPSLHAEDNQVDSSATKRKRKLRERMKDVGQGQNHSQESHEHHSELSDVHAALESLKTGTTSARRAAKKEATKAKALSDERVVESDEEQAPTNEEQPVFVEEPSENTGQPANSEEQPVDEESLSANVEDLPENDENENEAPSNGEQLSANHVESLEIEEPASANREQPFANLEKASENKQLASVDREQPSAKLDEVSENEEMVSANREQPSVNLEDVSENEEESPVDEGKSSENEEEPIVDEEESSENESVAPVVNGYTLTQAEEDPMDLDQTSSQSSQDTSEAEEDGMETDDHDTHSSQDTSEADEDEMELDNHNAYTAPGGPEAEENSPSSEDEEDILLDHIQESAIIDEAEEDEESTQHYDHESVDLDAGRDPKPNGDLDDNKTLGSDAETDFHGFQDGDGDVGSVDLDTPVRTGIRKRLASPVTFEEKTPKVNGFTNGHRHVEVEEQVSSDDDDMSDIPAKIVPKARAAESTSKKKSKPKIKAKKRPLGFR
jgi:Myb-like DNA-binding domain